MCTDPVPATTGKNLTWIVFFLMLTVLAGLGILVPLWYNLSLQLNAGQVAAAKEMWKEKGPTDYDLKYMTKMDTDEPVEYRVGVRSRRVQWVANADPKVVVILEMAEDFRATVGGVVGCPVQFCSKGFAAADELTRQHSIDGFFALIESKLRDDVAVGGRNYATATFDSKLGYPVGYIHRVRRSSERIALNVILLPPNSPADVH